MSPAMSGTCRSSRRPARILLPPNATGVRASPLPAPMEPGRRRRSPPKVAHHHDDDPHCWISRGLTAVVGWDQGIVAALRRWIGRETFLVTTGHWEFLARLPSSCIACGAQAGIRLHRPITVPPNPRIDPAPRRSRNLVDDSPDTRDLTATIVDLAVRGYLRIAEQKAERGFGLWSKYRLSGFNAPNPRRVENLAGL